MLEEARLQEVIHQLTGELAGALHVATVVAGQKLGLFRALAEVGPASVAGIASVAQRRDIQLRAATAALTGDMNLLGVLGADPVIRNGFGAVRVHFTIDADASEDEIAAIVAQSQKRSAVFDIITSPTNVTVTVN